MGVARGGHFGEVLVDWQHSAGESLEVWTAVGRQLYDRAIIYTIWSEDWEWEDIISHQSLNMDAWDNKAEITYMYLTLHKKCT